MFNDPRKVFNLIPIILLIIGIGLGIGAFFTFRSSQAFLATAVTGSGQVIGYERRNNSEGEISYYPVIEYTPAGGELTEFTSNIGSGNRSYRIGETVPLRCDPADPFRAQIDSPMSVWLAPAILGVMSLAFIVVSSVVLWNFRADGPLGRGMADTRAEIDQAIAADELAWDEEDEEDEEEADEAAAPPPAKTPAPSYQEPKVKVL